MSESDRLPVFLPSVFVVPPKVPPPPPPVPGTVEPEDLRPPSDPPCFFVKPWKSFEEHPRDATGSSIPVTIDAVGLDTFCERHEVRATLETVFKDRNNRDEIVDRVMRTLRDPFRANPDSDIVWTLVPAIKPNPDRDAKLGGKKLVRRHKILRGPPWSVVCFGDANCGVRRNVIYDGEGSAIAQVDFGHGNAIGIHVHALVLDNLEHTPGSSEDHCFPLNSIPWPWVCIPDVRSHPCAEKMGSAFSALPTTLDMVRGEMAWLPLSFPFEDYLGGQALSDEW